MAKLFLMFVEFFKIGLFAVGGGLATIPFLTDLSYKYGWYSIADLSTMIAVSESTPGAMGVNMATYVGFSQANVLGAIVVTIGLVAPSIIVICIIAKMFAKFKESKLVKDIFFGLKPAVVGFIGVATVDIIINALFNGALNISSLNLKALGLLIGLFALKKWMPKMHPIGFIILSALFGIILGL